MIKDIADFNNGDEIRADAVVVGSGLAGIEAARQLARRGLRVAVLESGRQEFDAELDALNEIRSVGKPHRRYEPGSDLHQYLPEHYRGLNRVRQFGGTSNSWTGKWRAFTPGDFNGQPWIPQSGWPIGFEDLAPSYEAVAAEYGIGDVIGERQTPAFRAREEALASAGLQLAVHYWQKETTRVSSHFQDALKSSTRIDVILRATATELVLDETLERVCAVESRSLEGRRLTIRAGWVVLATGALEAPRLLLASNRQIPAGIGNARDLVGRYYMDHLKEQSGRLRPGPRIGLIGPALQNMPRPRFCLSLALADAFRAKHKLLRHSLYLNPRYEGLADRLKTKLSFQKRYRDEVGSIRHYRVKFATEQVPNPKSRVYLGKQRDALGMPQLVIDWQFTDLDHRSIEEACAHLRAAFAKVQLGDLQFGASPMNIAATMDSAHPMGTTRMADSDEKGVVDPNCRVFGSQNLFIASASVFPTGAVYSPTFTIVALANRIGNHIADLHLGAKGDP